MSGSPQRPRYPLAFALLSTTYVGIVALRHTAHTDAVVALLGASLLLVWFGVRAGGVLAWASWGLSLTIASAEPSFATHISAWVGAVVASAAGVLAVARLAPTGGIVSPREPSARLGLVILALVWLPAALALVFASQRIDWTLTSGAALSCLVLMGFGMASRLGRHLVLGVALRLDSLLLASLGAGSGAIAIAVEGRFGTAWPACLASAPRFGL